MLELILTTSYKKQVKRYKHDKPVLQELSKVIKMLLEEQSLPSQYRNHKLVGNKVGMMELHLRPDDLLVYFKVENTSVTLVAIGNHAEVFG